MTFRVLAGILFLCVLSSCGATSEGEQTGSASPDPSSVPGSTETQTATVVRVEDPDWRQAGPEPSESMRIIYATAAYGNLYMVRMTHQQPYTELEVSMVSGSSRKELGKVNISGEDPDSISIASDKNGNVWMTFLAARDAHWRDIRIYSFRNEIWKEEMSKSLAGKSYAFRLDDAGNPWLAARFGDGLALLTLTDGSWQSPGPETPLAEGAAKGFNVSSGGYILLRRNDTAVSSDISRPVFDPTGNLWVTVNNFQGIGTARWNGTDWELVGGLRYNYTGKETSARVFSTMFDPSGNPYLIFPNTDTGDNPRVDTFTGGEWHEFDLPIETDAQVLDVPLCVTPDGAIYAIRTQAIYKGEGVGYESTSELVRFDGKKWRVVSESETIKNMTEPALSMSPDGTLYLYDTYNDAIYTYKKAQK